VVVQVVEVRAVDDGGDAACLRLGGGQREQVVLAEEAAVHRVLRVAGIVELVGRG
jgi:hypothetical protein